VSRTLDFLCLLGAFAGTSSLVSYLSRSDLFIWPAPASSDIAGWPAQYVVLLLSTLIAWSLISSYLGEHDTDQPDRSQISRLVRADMLWMAATAVAIFVFKLREISRLFLIVYMVLGGASIALRDWAERMVRRTIQRRRGTHRSAIVVGNGTQARWLRQFLLDNYCPEPYALVRQVDPADPEFIDGQAGSKSQAAGFDRAEVFVAVADIGGDASALFPRLFERATEAHIVPGVFDASIFKLALRSVGGVPLITLRSGALTGPEGALKRAFDIAVAALLLTLLAPLMTIIALLIKVSSRGPVFFRQERVGKGGRRIEIYKFRTMHQDAESILKANSELYRSYVENNYKLPRGEDPRVTLVGGFLRELSLDEIPQLFNVLKGEMSLVGPRPVVPEEIEKYGDYASLLLSVQPGLTGQWQVSGRSNIADYARRVRIDMEYIRDQSIAKDLQILFRTLPVVLSREGAH
jgi:exopolysaccharide production protein ExoY